MKNPESQLQQACIRWFISQHRKLWDEVKIHAVPNGGARNPITGAILKAEGTRKGVWDIAITEPRGKYAGAWIECKAGKNKLTPEQKAFQESHKQHFFFAVCYSLEEFIAAVTTYLIGEPGH